MADPDVSKKSRTWQRYWPDKASNSGELLRAWCIRPVNEVGVVRCRFCKNKIDFKNKGLYALVRHANSMKHIENGRIFKLRSLKMIEIKKAKQAGKVKSGATLLKKSHHQKSAPRRPNPSSIKTSFASQNEVNKPVKKKTNTGTHAKKPVASFKSPPSSISPKYTLSISSEPFLQKKFDPWKSKPLLPSGTHPAKAELSLKTLPRFFNSANRSSSKANVNANSQLLLHKLARITSAPNPTSGLPTQAQDALPLLSGNSPRAASSLAGNHPSKSFPETSRIYSGSNLQATNPPFFHHPERLVKLIPVFLCYFCHEEFSTKTLLHEHQAKCGAFLTSGATIDFSSTKTGETPPTLTSVMTPPSHESPNCSLSPSQESLDSNLPPLQTALLPAQDEEEVICLPFMASILTPTSTPPKLKNKLQPLPVSDDSPSKVACLPTKSTLLNNLGLLPKKVALKQQLKNSRKRRNTECESLDWEEEELVPKTPCTPPTSKLLISHLSREEHRHDSPSRRLFRLSSSIDLWKKEPVDKETDSMPLLKTMTDSSQNSNEENSENIEEKNDDSDSKISIAKSLYNVDVTSPLGQFVIRHYKSDPSLHILSDIESHCLTSKPVSDNTNRCSLRARTKEYPIVFGGIGRRFMYHDYYHIYKFNRKQVSEFMKTVNTGLNKSSRHLSRQMKKCRVRLQRISKADLKYWIPVPKSARVDLTPLSLAEIAYWTTPKSTLSSDGEESICVFPHGLNFYSPNVKRVLGLQPKKQVRIQVQEQATLSILNISNFVSEEVCADLLSNRKTVYQCLLSDCCRIQDSENVSQLSKTSSILRQILNKGHAMRKIRSLNSLPDITNINMPIAGANNAMNELPAAPKVPIVKEAEDKRNGGGATSNSVSLKNGLENRENDLKLSDVSTHSNSGSQDSLIRASKPLVITGLKGNSRNIRKKTSPRHSPLPTENRRVYSQDREQNQEKELSFHNADDSRCNSTASGTKICGNFLVKAKCCSEGEVVDSVLDDPHLLEPFLEYFTELRAGTKNEIGSVKIRKFDRPVLSRGKQMETNRQPLSDCGDSVMKDTRNQELGKGVLKVGDSTNQIRSSRSKRRRKSSSGSRLTKTGSQSLTRRLSAAGLTKREQSLKMSVSSTSSCILPEGMPCITAVSCDGKEDALPELQSTPLTVVKKQDEPESSLVTKSCLVKRNALSENKSSRKGYSIVGKESLSFGPDRKRKVFQSVSAFSKYV